MRLPVEVRKLAEQYRKGRTLKQLGMKSKKAALQTLREAMVERARSPVLDQGQEKKTSSGDFNNSRRIRKEVGGTRARPLPPCDSPLRLVGTCFTMPDIASYIRRFGTEDARSTETTELGIFNAKRFWNRSADRSQRQAHALERQAKATPIVNAIRRLCAFNVVRIIPTGTKTPR